MNISPALLRPSLASRRRRISATLAVSFACLFPFTLLTAGPAMAAPQGSSVMHSGAVIQDDAASSALVRLPGHLMPASVQRATLIGRKPGTEDVSLTLALSSRDPVGLQTLLRRQYSPGDLLFHHFLSSAEFTRRFSPTAQSYAQIAAFAKANGLAVVGTSPSRLILEVSGPTAAVETAFRVHLRSYVAADGHTFHAPDSEPAVPSALAGKLAGVIGLQNAGVRHPHLQRRSYSFLPAQIGSDPNDGALTPHDIKNAYNLSLNTLTGAGRTLGLMELDGYTASDITAYENAYSLTHVPLVNILTGGATGVPSETGGDSEVTLDIELMVALAPGVSAIRVYEAPDTAAGEIAAFGQIASDNVAKEVSTSWGLAENESDEATLTAENTIFQQMAAQGQSLYAAAGDSGAYDDGTDLSVDDPASQPFVTGVGGTHLQVVARGGGYRAESTWGNTAQATTDSPLGAGGGGGISGVWPLPDYQNGVAGLGSETLRNVPDVALDADPDTGYSIYYGGGWDIFGGTSCAAPLWAAFTALANQQRTINQEADLGFPNPAIYQIASVAASYKSGFHDIADGSTNLFYHAATGYDNATGWGTFNGANLLALFAPAVVVSTNSISALTLDPTSVVGGLTVKGTVTLTNPAPVGGATVTLSASTGPASVPASVTIAAGASSADFVVTTTAVTTSTPVTLTAAYSGSTLTAALIVLPAPALITPKSLSLSPASVGNGASSVATLMLTGPAPAEGLTVTLTSSDPAATVPATITVPSGAVSAQFNVSTVPVTTQVTATISATANSVTQTGVLTIEAPVLEPIALAPVSVIGGQSATATLTLTFPAPAGGAGISLTSSDPAAVLPATVTIPAGTSTIPVTVTTSIVQATTAVTLTATYAGVTQKTVLTVNAVLPAALTVAPTSVIGGTSSLATLTLNAAAPTGGLTASLSSSNTAAAQVPATLAIPAGAVSASFTVSTALVTAAVTSTITATLNNTTETADLTVQPIVVSALTLSAPSISTGTAVTGRLTLNASAPAGGETVTLSSSSPSAAVPSTVLVPAGATEATFAVAAPHPGSAVITATLNGASQTAALAVSAAPGTTFPAGLNMISAPYDYSGVSLDSLFGYTGVRLATEMPATGTYVFTPSAPAETLHLGRGYWVNLPAAVTLSSVGTPADPTHAFAIALLPGWNQIGDPFPAAITLGNVSVNGTTFSQATTADPLLVSSLVYRYAPQQGTTAGSYVWVRDTDSLQPGLGYWIYAYQAVTLTIPHP